MKNILEFTFDELESYLIQKNEKKYRVKQLFDWIYKKNVTDFSKMSNVSNDIKELFLTNILDLEIEEIQESFDKTKKYLFKLNDGELIETVLMPQKYGYSICLTTQVGCRIGCKFCASGVNGLIRNLTMSEILSQYLFVQQDIKKEDSETGINSIVVMGIGEPFDNYDNTINSLKNLNDERGGNIGSRKITISTSGNPEKIIRYTDEEHKFLLAFSLHSAINFKRTMLMPINAVYKLDDIKESLKYYSKNMNRRITLEYLLIHNINDQLEDAVALKEFIYDLGMKVHVNLIPYNEVEFNDYTTSNDETIEEFYNYLVKNKINVTTRKEFGSDIDAACGQLRLKKGGE